MLNAKTTLPLLLVNLLAVTADTTVNVKSKIRFSTPVVASFVIDNPTTNDYIGIYRRDANDSLSTNPFDMELQFWAYTNSGTQETTLLPALGRGRVTFNGVDPSEEGADQWPMNPRTYKVCPMRESYDSDNKEKGELLADCVPLEIKLANRIRNRVEREAFVSALQPEGGVKVGVPFQVSFNSRVKSSNSWIGIYHDDDLENTIMWVYTGCDNVLGDQEGIESNDCLKKRKRGTVTFSEENTGRATQIWPLPEGEYVLRLEYFNNSPHELYKQAVNTLKVVA